jgi:hypothetical protein
MTSITIAVLLGTVLAILTTILGLRWMRSSQFLVLPNATPTRLARIVPLVLAIAAFPFAWWLGFILGGNFGGATGASVADVAGGETVLVPIGIGLGIFFATAAISLGIAGIGLLATRLFLRIRAHAGS